MLKRIDKDEKMKRKEEKTALGEECCGVMTDDSRHSRPAERSRVG